MSLAIGNMNAVEQYFDTRFDIYNQDPPLASPSADPPGVNVRKGYLPGHKSNAVDWCSATPAAGSNLYYTYPSDRTVGAATQNSPILTDVANTTGIADGEPVIDEALQRPPEVRSLQEWHEVARAATMRARRDIPAPIGT